MRSLWMPAVALAACGLARAEERPAGKLLLGFEREALRKAVGGRKGRAFVFEVKGETVEFGRRAPGGGYTWYYDTVCVAAKEKATEGEYALKVELPIQAGWPDRPEATTKRNWAVFASYVGTGDQNLNEYEAFFPQDWSGHELLRVDLFAERPETGHPTQVQLRICDRDLDPPLSCTYEVPAGKGVTLEFDLERAVRERGLALDKMGFFLLVLGPQQRFRPARSSRDREKGTFYVDNIRLARRGAEAGLPVLRDEAGFEVKGPRAYAVAYKVVKDQQGRESIGWRDAGMEMPEPAKIERESGPKRLEPPCLIDLSACKEIGPDELSSLSLGEELAAFDAKRILVPFRSSFPRPWFPYHDRDPRNFTFVLGTTDGGATWKGLDGTQRPFPFTNSHHRAGFCVGVGGDLFLFSDFGCQGTGHSYPIDKGFVRRTVATDGGWWVSPYYFVDPHELHCIDQHAGVAQPSGRLWAAWPPSWSFRPPGVCARYSDDGGRTWNGWRGPGKSPAIPGMSSGHTSVVPYGGHIAVFVRAGYNRSVWTAFDGKAWSEPRECPSPYGQHPVSPGGKEIVMAGHGGVWAFDGAAWKKELELPAPPRGAPMPRLAVCGGSVLCFDRDATGKKLLCRRRLGGAWTEPVAVASEETEIVEFATQRHAPADFAPVAYICREKEEVVQELIKKGANPRRVRRFRPWIKLVKVPAR